MTITIILNGLEKKKKKFYRDFYPLLHQNFPLDIRETHYSGHAYQLAREAVSQKVEVLLTAGGDGTLSQVVNGVLAEDYVSPVLGLIPLGSANDFARACGLKNDVTSLIELLKAMKPRSLDAGRIQCQRDRQKITHYFINECSIGMGPEVVKRLVKTGKKYGPSLSYLISILSTFLSHKPQEVECRTPNWVWKGKARVLAHANGKSFGNSIYIAPDALPDDGLLNSFIAGEIPLLKFLIFLQTIKSGKKINDANIHYKITDRAEWLSPEDIDLEADGEMVGKLPAAIDVLRGRINFLY